VTHAHTHTRTPTYTHTHKRIIECTSTGWRRPIGCLRSLFGKEPIIVGLFCGKWPIHRRHPMRLRHPVMTHAHTRACTHTRKHTPHTHTHTHSRAHTRTKTNTHTHTKTNTHTHTHTHMRYVVKAPMPTYTSCIFYKTKQPCKTKVVFFKEIYLMELVAGCTLQRSASPCDAHCSTLKHAATHCNTRDLSKRACYLLFTAVHCNARQCTLQHAATHCNTQQCTLQHTRDLFWEPVTCCPLQHTATHNNARYNILQHTEKCM